MSTPLPSIQVLVDLIQFSLQSVAGSAQFGNGLFSEELLQSPLLDILRFVLLELSDELNCALKNASLVLLTAWYDLGELINTLIDGFAAATFDWISGK